MNRRSFCLRTSRLPVTLTPPEHHFAKSLERQTVAYKTAVAAVGHIELKYTIKTYTDATNYSEEEVTELIALHEIGNWNINKKITYKITIDLSSNIIYWDPTVEAWAEDNQTVTI